MTEKVLQPRSQAYPKTVPGPDVKSAKAPTWRKLWRNVGLLIGICWLFGLTLMALLVNVLPIPAYDQIVGTPLQGLFSDGAPLGTDQIGRSILSRVLYGAQTSLILGLVSSAIGVVMGGLLGLVAGYFRGVIEVIVDIIADVVLAFPPILFLVALAAAVRPSLTSLTISMAILMVPSFARMTKGAVIAQSEREFVHAARALGASHTRIIFREIFPNILMSLVSFTVIVMALVIVIEGSVSFLGYGIPVPFPSWGGMVAEAQNQLANHPSTVLIPIVFLFMTVFSLNAIGDWLRARFDPGQSQL